MNRRGGLDIGRILIYLILAGGVYAAYAYVPPYWEFMNFEEAVTESAYYWRDKRNRERTINRFNRELQLRNLHNDYSHEDCEFWEDGMAGTKHIACGYWVEIQIPGMESRWIEFYTHQYIGKDGYLYAQDADGNPL